MSKITFRADDDLIRQLEDFDASKSEVMREALRAYLDGHATSDGLTVEPEAETVDDAIADRVDEIIADRLEGAFAPRAPQDVNVNINVDGEGVSADGTDAAVSDAPSADHATVDGDRKTDADAESATEEARACSQCGETITPGHVYCPNCGEKASHRVFCECGDELRSDWAFCPSCGRRTPAADVLDQS